MSLKPVDFYHLACVLNTENNGCESYIRTTISRAYYSAFLEAREKSGVGTKTSNVHEEVAKHYLNKTGKRAIGNRLNDLRVLRNESDYHINKKITSLQSGKALAYARKILEELGVVVTK